MRLRIKYLAGLTVLAALALAVVIYRPSPDKIRFVLRLFDDVKGVLRQRPLSQAPPSGLPADGGDSSAAGLQEGGGSLGPRNRSSSALWAGSGSDGRAVCVGANASLGEVEDLLCMVSYGDVAAQVVERRPRDPMDSMGRGSNPVRPEHKKNL